MFNGNHTKTNLKGCYSLTTARKKNSPYVSKLIEFRQPNNLLELRDDNHYTSRIICEVGS